MVYRLWIKCSSSKTQFGSEFSRPSFSDCSKWVRHTDSSQRPTKFDKDFDIKSRYKMYFEYVQKPLRLSFSAKHSKFSVAHSTFSLKNYFSRFHFLHNQHLSHCCCICFQRWFLSILKYILSKVAQSEL